LFLNSSGDGLGALQVALAASRAVVLPLLIHDDVAPVALRIAEVISELTASLVNRSECDSHVVVWGRLAPGCSFVRLPWFMDSYSGGEEVTDEQSADREIAAPALRAELRLVRE
jgi:hypothetical protein